MELWLANGGDGSHVAAGLPHLPAGQQGVGSRGRLPGLAPRERGLRGPRGIPELAGSQTCRGHKGTSEGWLKTGGNGGVWEVWH